MSWMADGFLERAVACVRGRDYDSAKALLVEAIKLKPDFAEAWTLRGNVLLAQEQPFEAMLHYERAVSIRPEAYDAWSNLGQCMGSLGLWQAAEAAFHKSSELMPTAAAHIGLANMYCTLMRLKDAADEYRKAVAFDATDYEARFNLGVTLLGLGQWEEGFREYEQRWLNDPLPPLAYRRYPKWRGEDFSNKVLLLYPEQGYGDEIMAFRFASLVGIYTNARVIVETRSPFTRLAKGGVEVITRGDSYPDGIDFSCPLLDVPMVLGIKPYDTHMLVPKSGRYLYSRQSEIDAWKIRLDELPRGLNVGLCWASGRHMSTVLAARNMKSVPIKLLAGLAMPGVNLISLQKPVEPDTGGLNIVDWTDELDDLADTAALIESLDLVITVDTAVAHLAGALGKPCWNLVRFSGYWPWLAPEVLNDPSKSIWYPSMTLYRQPVLGDWVTPVRKIIENLEYLVKNKELGVGFYTHAFEEATA
jgi:Tfp pilus assembly protein PilF